MDQMRGRKILRLLFTKEKLVYSCKSCVFLSTCPIKKGTDCPLKSAEQLLSK